MKEKMGNGIGITPEMTSEMLAKADEMEKFIRDNRRTSSAPGEIKSAAEKDWKKLDGPRLLLVAKNTQEQWALSPETYLKLAEALRREASGGNESAAA